MDLAGGTVNVGAGSVTAGHGRVTPGGSHSRYAHAPRLDRRSRGAIVEQRVIYVNARRCRCSGFLTILLPAVRAADPGTLIVADGTSCRHQIADGTDRAALHVARVLAMSLDTAQSNP